MSTPKDNARAALQAVARNLRACPTCHGREPCARIDSSIQQERKTAADALDAIGDTQAATLLRNVQLPLNAAWCEEHAAQLN